MTFDLDSTAILVIDMQYCYLGPRKERKLAAVGPCRSLLNEARDREIPIFQVSTQYAGKEEMPPGPLSRNEEPYRPPETDILACLREESDIPILKKHFSAFIDTDLVKRLQDAERDRLIICGIAADCCVLQTAHHAHQLGFQSIIPYQTTSSTTREKYVGGLHSLHGALANVVSYNGSLASMDTGLAYDGLDRILNDHYASQATRIDSYGTEFHDRYVGDPIAAVDWLVTACS